MKFNMREETMQFLRFYWSEYDEPISTEEVTKSLRLLVLLDQEFIECDGDYLVDCEAADPEMEEYTEDSEYNIYVYEISRTKGKKKSYVAEELT